MVGLSYSHFKMLEETETILDTCKSYQLFFKLEMIKRSLCPDTDSTHFNSPSGNRSRSNRNLFLTLLVGIIVEVIVIVCVFR